MSGAKQVQVSTSAKNKKEYLGSNGHKGLLGGKTSNNAFAPLANIMEHDMTYLDNEYINEWGNKGENIGNHAH